jgi:predicted nucleotide-binding protein
MRERFEGREGKRRLAEAFCNNELVRNDRSLAQCLVRIAKVQEHEESAEVYQRGEPGNGFFYFIIAGSVDLTVQGIPRRRLIAGQGFGEFPILDPSLAYTVSARASEKTILATISEHEFKAVAAKNPALWENTAKMLATRLRLASRDVERPEKPRVFIGHGRSPTWMQLRDFLQDELHVCWDEFERVSPAGVTNTDRLAAMLDQCSMALLVMTAEDEHADGSWAARMNVVHEIGFSQGRLGFKRAIVLLEEGCGEFSNIQGLGQIRFQKGNIKSKFKEIQRVLEEGLVATNKGFQNESRR